MTSLAVIILTLNEERNIAHSLQSVVAWADEVFILDSYSQHRTLEIAQTFPCHIQQNKFVDYAKQRNYALRELPIRSEWIFFLDAEEWRPQALKDELSGRRKKTASTLSGASCGWASGSGVAIATFPPCPRAMRGPISQRAHRVRRPRKLILSGRQRSLGKLNGHPIESPQIAASRGIIFVRLSHKISAQSAHEC
jgi:glycosyltransferase involved in cell wall biosynthesis